MTDITPEQRAAWERVRSYLALGDADLLSSLLPAELTNPQPELPTAFGAYAGYSGDVWLLTRSGSWIAADGDEYGDPGAFAPFTRLVPERPTITREQMVAAVDKALRAGSALSGPFIDVLYAALVNGKGAES